IGDIAAGLAYSVIKNCFNKVLKLNSYDQLGQNVVVQGGTFKNEAVLRALEKILGREVVRPAISELMGAYGAALWAAHNHSSVPGTFIGLDNIKKAQKYTEKTINCRGCANYCRVKLLKFENGRKFYTGNRCEKIFSNKGNNRRHGKNIFPQKYELTFNRCLIPDIPPKAVIGIPRILNFFDNFPFWAALFTECGFEVKLSGVSTDKILAKGMATVMSENICLPAKLANGHILDLLHARVDRIFFPIIVNEMGEIKGTVNNYNCPVVAGYPDVIRSAVDPEKYDIAYDTPVITFNNKILLKKSILRYLKKIGIKRKTAVRAFNTALSIYTAFKQEIKRRGQEIIKDSQNNNKLLIVLAGRPYHADSLINHKIPELISAHGVNVVSNDCLPLEDLQGEIKVLSQWEYSNRLYNSAKWTGKQPNCALIQLNSFGCGPDALTVDEVKSILQSHGKVLTLLRIDEMTNMGSVKLRIRSMLASLQYKKQTDLSLLPSGKIRKSTPPFLPQDNHKTILVPDLAEHYSQLLPGFFKALGYNTKILPRATSAAVAYGLRFANNDICYPATICIGTILQALASGEYDPSNTAVMISETGGQCRASNYSSLLKKALLRAGYKEIPVITLSTAASKLNFQPGFNLDLQKTFYYGFYGMLFTDLIIAMKYKTAAREKNKGDAYKTATDFINKAGTLFNSKIKKNTFNLLRKAVTAFNSIPCREEQPPRIGIVGEIFIKYNEFGNRRITDYLLSENIEPVVPPMLDFFVNSIPSAAANEKLFLQSKKISNTILRKIIKHYILHQFKKACSILKKFRWPHEFLHNFDKTADYASDILSLSNQFGEGWGLAGEIISLYKQGIKNIVCLQPFGCIANHIIAKGIAKRIQKLYPDINLLFLDSDAGSSEVNLMNRLKFLINSAKES
ncbi:MAG TPA: acyl-CoA dehydratase activase-related protein, partial [Spirochaetota bacterium]|nr:acyl-CoA dehydratase activase-related protein [Spirochaetota bacterium]